MSSEAGPTPNVSGLGHISFTVTNLEDSLDWYQRVFRAERIDYKFAHLYRERTGYGVMLSLPDAGLYLALHTNTGNQHEGFHEARTGLDHVSFRVENHAALDAWMAWLDELGIEHTPIRDQEEPFAYSTVVFRDPDNIQLEFVAVG